MVRKTKIRIGSADPGRFKDSFAVVITEVDLTERKIRVIGAKEYKGIKYPLVEADIARAYRELELDFFIVEQNNTGIHVIESLIHVHKIPILGVITGNRIKDPRKIRSGRNLDKTEMVEWIEKKRQQGKIIFPRIPNEFVKILITQLDSFIRQKPTKAGNITYSAEGEGHDDLVMAFMVNLYFIRSRIWKEGSSNRIVGSVKRITSQENSLGSGIPEGATLLGSSTIYPTW